MECQAEVPSGARPGQTFIAQTPNGPVAVQVPIGFVPGQRLRFSAPPAASGVTAASPPVVVGRFEATPAVVVGGAGSSAGYRPGVPYRTDPRYAQVDNLPLLHGIPVAQAERKVDEIHKGGALAQEWPCFPPTRRCRDALWIIPFLLVTAAMIVGAVYFSQIISKKMLAQGVHLPPARCMTVAGVIGGGASLIVALLFASLAKCAPGCVVWTSLLFSPVLTIVGGFALLGLRQYILGGILLALGVLTLMCVFCCFKRLIPFMIKIVETVAGIMKENPMMLSVALLGSLLGVGWAVISVLVFSGVFLKYEDTLANTNDGARFGLMFAAALIWFWGWQVAHNICHVTYCGVFGRWYFKADEHRPVRNSLKVALTTSFGSICFGSFLIAAIRALEMVLRQARMNAQQDGNVVCCIILLVLECVVACIGDILEYFSEWAYVQCAVRGVSFIEAARITYSMITCANVEFIVQDLLINFVVSLGALLCALVGCAVGAGVGFGMGGAAVSTAGGVVGLVAGMIAGGAAIGALGSGTKTILALWAEDPAPLQQMRPEIHWEFEQRILSKLSS